MEPPLFLLLLLLPFFLFSHVCQAYGITLHPNWSFSADLSLSSPFPLNAFSSPSLSLFTPILSSLAFSSGKGFSLGFYSLFDSSSNPSPTTIFLTVCLGTNKTGSSGRSFAVPIWHFDRTRPLKQVGKTGLVSLSVDSPNMDLVLRDGDGSVFWKVPNVQAMEIQDNGNWALYNEKKDLVWQSLDHPSNTLLQGQTLNLSQKLVSNNSHFIIEMLPGGLMFSMNSSAPAPLIYWAVPLNVTLIEYVYQHPFDLSTHPLVNVTASLSSYSCPQSSNPPTPSYAIFHGGNVTVRGDCSSFEWNSFTNIFRNSTYTSDFATLSDDGYLKGYTYLHLLGENYLFSGQNYNISYSCLVPNACGPYGICSEYVLGTEHTCQCPSSFDNPEFKSSFEPINPSNPTQGCRRTLPLQCSDNGSKISLVEIKKVTFVSIHPVFETTYRQNTRSLNECISECAGNCSCSGFFYHYGSSYCLPFSDTIADMSNLTFITVDSTDFSTYVKLLDQRGDKSSSLSVATPNQSSGAWSNPVVYVVAGAIFMMILSLFVLLVFRYRHVKMAKNMDDEELETGDDDLRGVLPLLPVRYTYKELYRITDGFSVENWIGSGGFGSVYRGVVMDGRKVAVKKLDTGSPRRKEFLAEVATIGDVSHFNIARLCGFCSEKSHRLLVYEFMDNGSLDQWLFSDSKDRMLSWTTRYSVALGTARGLAYLHEECPRPIIHFDVKPQNILLDREFVAKISDFGLCKLVGRADSSCVMTGVRGTPGYLAPEWLSHVVVGKKCDVYSFGMVLLEMVGGRKNAVQALVGSEQWYFPMWAAVLWKQGRIKELVDGRLEGVFDEEQARRIVHVAFLCIQREPSARPCMGSVYQMIEGSLPLGDEEPPFDLAMEPLSPEHPISLAYSCTSALLVGR